MDEPKPNKWTGEAIETAIDEALRSAPLEAVPPGLYQAVMQQIQTQNLPRGVIQVQNTPARPIPLEKMRFRITWLDLALSLFGAGMLALTGIAWNWLPAPISSYLRLQAIYGWHQLISTDQAILLWCGLALVALLAGLLAGLWSCIRLGVCNRGVG